MTKPPAASPWTSERSLPPSETSVFLWRAGSSPAGWRRQDGFLSRYSGERFWPVGAAREQRQTTRLSATGDDAARSHAVVSDLQTLTSFIATTTVLLFSISRIPGSVFQLCLQSGCKSRRRPQTGKPGQVHRPLLARRGSGTSPAPPLL